MIKKLNIFNLLIGLVLLVGLLPITYDNIKYILVPLALSLLLLKNRSLDFSGFDKIDLSILLFVILNFCSSFWSTDIYLALSESFYWSIYAFSMLVFRRIFKDERLANIFHIGLVILFLVLLTQHLIAIHLDVDQQKEWNLFFSKNRNYTTTYLVALYPFFLHFPFRDKLLRFIKFIAGTLLINLVFITSALPALFGIIGILCFYLFRRYQTRLTRQVLALSYVVLFIGIFVFMGKKSIKDPFNLLQTYQTQLPSNKYMNNSAVKLFKENIPIGVGAGNWVNLAYDSDLSKVKPFNESNRFIRHRSHSLYYKTLAELGIFGIILLLFPFLLAGFHYCKNFDESSSTEHACMAALIVYLVVSGFYASVNFHDNYFSSIQLLSFLSLAYFLKDKATIASTSNQAKYVYVFIGIVLCSWFSWKYYNIRKFNQNDKQENIDNKLMALQAQYDLGISQINKSTKLAFEIATVAQEKNEIILAERYYKEGLEKYPNDLPALASLSKLYLQKGELDVAKPLIEKCIEIQKTYCPCMVNSAHLLALQNSYTNKRELSINNLLKKGCIKEGSSIMQYLENSTTK